MTLCVPASYIHLLVDASTWKMWHQIVLPLGFLLCSRVARSAGVVQKPLLRHLDSGAPDPRHDIFAFHKNLTEIESITYNEEKAGIWLANSLESQGYSVEKQWVDEDEGRFNVYAYPGHVRETKLLITSHYDTVGSRLYHVLRKANTDAPRCRLSMPIDGRMGPFMAAVVLTIRPAWQHS